MVFIVCISRCQLEKKPQWESVIEAKWDCSQEATRSGWPWKLLPENRGLIHVGLGERVLASQALLPQAELPAWVTWDFWFFE